MKSITLQTSDSSISVNEILGRLGFAASSESDGADSVLVAATIEAVAEGNFTQTSNATSLVFSTASSSTAEERLKITSTGHLLPVSTTPNSQNLGSTTNMFGTVHTGSIYFNTTNVDTISGTSDGILIYSIMQDITLNTFALNDARSLVCTNSPLSSRPAVNINPDASNIDFTVYHDGSTSVPLFHCDADLERVGINTISPQYALDVVGSGHFDALNINGQYTFPTGVGSVGDSLVYAGSNQVAWSGVSVSLSGQLDGNLDLNGYDIVGTGNITIDGDVEANQFIGNLRGAIYFTAQAGEALTKGDVVYISGISGNKTVVSKADANDSSKMPAFGIAAETVSNNANVNIITFGSLYNIDTDTPDWDEGDELYVSNTAGVLTKTAPTGESSQIQKIAKVTRRDNSAGSIKVMGAGRTNATPNLNEGRLFVGNSSNQAVADGTIHVDIADSRVLIGQPFYSVSPFYKLEVNVGSRLNDGVAIFGTNNPAFTLAAYGYESDLSSPSAGVLNLSADTHDQASGSHIRFSVDSPEVARINSTGLGIGTSTNVTNKLQVEGGHVAFNQDNGSYTFKVGSAVNDNLLYVDGTSNDRVGIGTASPDVKLHIEGTAPHLRQENTLASSTISHYLFSDGANLGGLVGYGTSYAGGSVFGVGASGVGLVSNNGADLAVGTFGGAGNIRLGTNSTERVRIDGFGNVGIGTPSPSEKLDVNGTIRTRTGGIGHQDDGCYIAYPGGGTFEVTSSLQTGYLKITLPVSWTNTMLAFDIDIYEYASQKIKKLRVGGYNYTGNPTPLWINTSAMMDSDNDFAKYKVHFGHDGTKCAIYISEIGTNDIDQGASTTWNYANVSISNFFGGYANFTMANWADGWDVGFTTTLGTINNTIPVSRPYRQHDTSYVFNEYGGNVDFRIEGDTDQNLVFTDASTDRVGIGTATPSQKLDIRYPTGGGMALIKDSDSNDGLLFGDMAYSTSDAYQGIKHVGMTGSSDYMMISEGLHTLMSAKGTGGRVYIRGGGNYGSNQILVYGSSGYTENAAIELDAVAGKEIVVNQQQRNVDFRVEGNTDGSLLFTDASVDRVGIKTSSPDRDFHVNGETHLDGTTIIGTGLPSLGYRLTVDGNAMIDQLNINGNFTFPTTDGSADQVLVTNGSGALTWQDQQGAASSSNYIYSLIFR